MKKFFSMLGIVVLVCMVAIPGYANDKVFKIGGISSLQTGYGRSMVSGAGLAVEEINAAGGINGIMLSIEWQDGMLSPAIGRTGVQKLLHASNVDALIGDHSSATIISTIYSAMTRLVCFTSATNSDMAVATLRSRL